MRKKTTVYLDEDLLDAVKAFAANSGQHEFEVVEDALRAYVQPHDGDDAPSPDVRTVLDTGDEPENLSDGVAMELAYSELHAHRTEHRHS